MELEPLQDVSFYQTISIVIFFASIATLLLMTLYKKMFQSKLQQLNELKLDQHLRFIGRLLALICYLSCLLLYHFFLRIPFAFDQNLSLQLLTGCTATLTVTKGLYSWLHQKQKQQQALSRLLQNPPPPSPPSIVLKRKESDNGTSHR